MCLRRKGRRACRMSSSSSRIRALALGGRAGLPSSSITSTSTTASGSSAVNVPLQPGHLTVLPRSSSGTRSLRSQDGQDTVMGMIVFSPYRRSVEAQWRRGSDPVGSLNGNFPPLIFILGLYDRHSGCFSDRHAPPSLELATHCVIKFIPSTPSATLGYRLLLESSFSPAARAAISS